MYQLLLSYLASIGALFTFAMNVCLLNFGRHVQNRAYYMDVLLACFLLSFLSILYFSSSMLVCVYYPGWRVFRTSHTCIYPFPTFLTAFLYVYYFGSRVFRTSHTCIFPFPLQLFQTLFPLASCFQNEPCMRFIYVYHFGSRVGLTRPGTSLMRCSFTT